MDRARPRAWLTTAVIVALAYVVVGLTTAWLARVSGAELRTMWRRAAWGISAVVFALHLLRERHAAPAARTGAWHASAAVALATAVIAAEAIAHNLARAPLRAGMLLAFVVWPVLTGVGSFFVAWLALRVARPAARGPDP